MKRMRLSLFLALALWAFPCPEIDAQKAGQECFPVKSEDRLFYDEANVVDDAVEQRLAQTLSEFARTTSNQVVVVVVNDLCGMDRSQFAIELGEAWGVGQEKEDNGVVVLVKPKTPQENGKAFIAVGRGLTGAIPSATAYEIVSNEMIPHFKTGDYGTGIEAGLKVVMDLASGAYNHQVYDNDHRGRKRGTGAGAVLVFLVVLVVLFFKSRQVRQYARSNHLGFWAAWWLLNSMGNRHRGFWSDFSGGRGGFGGGGGFGGFGGGSFGGDGAGGSW